MQPGIDNRIGSSGQFLGSMASVPMGTHGENISPHFSSVFKIRLTDYYYIFSPRNEHGARNVFRVPAVRVCFVN